MDQIRVGIIGCVGISRRHVAALEAMREVQLVAFCDIQMERAEAYAARLGVRAYDNHKAMLRKERLDAVYILTPTFARGSQVRDAARRGIHIFAEKPVSLSLAQGRRDLRAVEESGVTASVGFILRYLKTAAEVKHFLADRQVTLASGWYLGGLPPMAWWASIEKSGGQMVDQNIHLLDLLRYLVGDVELVFACYGHEAFRGREGTSIADSCAVALRFANGAVGTMASTCCMSAPAPTPGIVLSGEDFRIEFTYKKLTIATREQTNEEPVDLMPGYAEENRIFINAVTSGDRDSILSSYRDGVKSAALALAINKSAETGKAVKVGGLG
jgi:predicted dehydrogenase